MMSMVASAGQARKHAVAGSCRIARWAVALGAALVLCAGQAPAWAQEEPAASAASANRRPSTPLPTPDIVSIVLRGAGTFGGDIGMVTQVFKPTGDGPFPVVIFSHGRSGDAFDRTRMSRPVAAEQVRFWLSRGMALVAPFRPGYGPTGGVDVENSGTRIDANGQCTSRPAYRPMAAAAKKTVSAALAWAQAQPWADGRRVVLAGQSVGGLTTVAAAADRPAGVLGYINFAGGAGGDPQRSPGRNCDPEQLTDVYTEFGRTTAMPNLWVYAENDQYWGRDAPKAWHAGFAKGGSRTTFIHAPPVADGNGHALSSRPQSLWASYVDEFLRTIDLPADAGHGPVQPVPRP